MRRRLSQLVAVTLAALLLAGPEAVSAQQSPLEDLLASAAAMTSRGQYAEAYALLASGEDTFIGDIDFDYALGRAALGAGRPARATMAFARVLALDPSHAGARIDTGRAYLALGNRAQARVAFEAVLALDPPPGVRTQLLAYLAETGERRGRALAMRGYLSISGGTSSNVNQAPGQSQVFVPGLVAVLQLSDQNVRKDDSFAGLGGGIEGAMPLGGRYSLIGGAEFSLRDNTHESDFDVGGIAANMGVAWAGEAHIVRAQFQGVVNTLGGRTSTEVRALSVDVTERAAAPGTPGTFFAFVHAGGYRHPPEELKVFDADFVTVGAGGNIAIDGKSTASVVLLAGGDQDRGGNPSGNRSGLGIRVSYDRVISPKLKFAAVLGTLSSQYDALDPAFLTVREDRRTDLAGILRYQLTPKLELSFAGLRIVQDSNIPIYEFRRTDWTLSLRRRFD